MYDTLMQMGRWFGYRGGYVDLCRLFTSRELNEWFCHITLATEELREEFDYMSDIAGSTPEQYALKVRTSPDGLMISAINKMRNATTVQISWAGRLVESYEFKKTYQLLIATSRILKNSYPLYLLILNLSLKMHFYGMIFLGNKLSVFLKESSLSRI